MDKFSPKQKQAYYNEKSKPGALYKSKKTGEIKEVSDFQRGVAHERAQKIFKARKKTAIKHQNENVFM